MEQKKKKVPGNPTRTVDSCKDERFAHIIKNPVYRPVPRKEKKVEIDKRFQGMFKDEQFKLKYKVDKRGRPVETTTDENLKRYYNLNEDDEDAEKNEEEKTDKKSKKPLTNKDDEDESSSEDSDSSVESGIEGDVKEEEIKSLPGSKEKVKLDEVTRKKLRSAEIDFARGEANFVEESSSDDDDSTTDEENDVPMVHDWGELDKDAPRTEGSSHRLALCNMDWDRVRAVDLMVLLGSFLPAGGVIKSVKIYPSEFGKERMAEEETEGPRELRESGDGPVKIKKEEVSSDEEDEGEMSNESEEDEDEEGEGSQYHREKLRQYQLNRLKYFYAVAEFDSAEAADKVYSECDGMEYESSAARVDLRFIPDDVTFDEDEPKDVCTVIPDGAKYRPRFFTTTALQQVKVDLTWDETDPMRKELTEKIFDPKEKVEDEDIRAYLATSSSESESEDENNEDAIKKEVISDQEGENEVEKPVKVKKSKEDAISKYKSLLQSIESTEKKKKEKDMEMEITWGVGLKDKTEKLVKKKLEEEENAKRTPWQEMLDKRKDKRRMRKQKGSDSESGSDSEGHDDTERNDESDQLFSDDDVDVDMSDEFFQSELRENEIFKNKANKPKKGEGKTKKDKGAGKGDKKEGKTNAELELLLMDEDDSKRHFSLKKIIAEESESSKPNKKKQKKRKKKFGGEAEDKDKRKDDFEIDLGDQRFSALFRSHQFNVDPSDPNFKKTKAMDKIIAEKQKRRETGKGAEMEGQRKKQQNDGNRNGVSKDANEVAEDDDEGSKAETKRDEINKKAELSYLVKSIKRKTENLKSKNAKRVKSKY